MTPTDARSLFAQGRVARLATVAESGAPHLVPVTFAVVDDRVVTAVDHKPKTTPGLKRLANIAHESRVSLLVDHYVEDWSRLWWVRADGIAEVRTSDPAAVDALVAKYPAYRELPPSGPVVVVDVRVWHGWSAADAASFG